MVELIGVRNTERGAAPALGPPDIPKRNKTPRSYATEQ
jgi:hypothetical protein